MEPVGGGGHGQVEVDHSGPHPGGAVEGVDLVDGVHQLGGDHHAPLGRHGAGSQPRPRPAGDDGRPVTGGDGDDALHLGRRTREGHHGGRAARPAGVLGVEVQGEAVVRDPIGAEQGLEIVGQAHGLIIRLAWVARA